ncbi:hypothetical protein [Enterococcus mundtii]|uniref:hypothetical protein n=1 Tax=Enterococcus mundtii TaxID=53346 RepID=UPI000CF1C609|nr:hypothetical protein [Enterococcus mundtii]PQC31493.1 hypothetical protein CUM97_05960 [Enterococcus mundtii]
MDKPKKNIEVTRFLNTAIRDGVLNPQAIGQESLSRLRLHILIKEQSLTINLKAPNLSDTVFQRISRQLDVVKKFSQQTASITAENIQLSAKQIDQKIERLTEKDRELNEQIREIKSEVKKLSSRTANPDEYNKATTKLNNANKELSNNRNNIYSHRAMKLVLKEQERQQTKSVRRESVDQSPRRQSVSQVTSEPPQSVAQKLSTPRQSLVQQQEKRTEKIDNLTEKIINTEKTIQALTKERDGLVSNPNVKEEFAIYTEGIQLHRKQADNLYRQLETIDSKTATKLETKFADSPYGKVACPLTPKEISAIKVEKANEKFNQAYRNASPEPKMNKKLRIDTGKTLSEKEKAAEQKKFIQETKRNLQKIENKLQKYQKRKKSIIGLIANAFQRKKIQGLKEKKTDLINKLKQPQKKTQKGILKPTFKEQVTDAHNKQEQQMKNQKPRGDRTQSPSFSRS